MSFLAKQHSHPLISFMQLLETLSPAHSNQCNQHMGRPL